MTVQSFFELLQSDFQRIRTEPVKSLIEFRSSTASKHAESARIPVAQFFPAFVQGDSHVSVK